MSHIMHIFLVAPNSALGIGLQEQGLIIPVPTPIIDSLTEIIVHIGNIPYAVELGPKTELLTKNIFCWWYQRRQHVAKHILQNKATVYFDMVQTGMSQEISCHSAGLRAISLLDYYHPGAPNLNYLIFRKC